MDKKEIKILVRESLSGLFEKSKKQNSEKEDKDKKKDSTDKEKEDEKSSTGSGESDKPLDQRDQNSIQQRLKDKLAPSMVDVCVASGILPSADTDGGERSECRKKLKQKDGLGLTDDEKDSVEKTLKIK